MAKEEVPLHERLQFDTGAGQVTDGPRRYVVMRADVLMGAFDGLPPAAREAALQSLQKSVADSGGDSVRAYLAAVGPDRLLRTMEEGSSSLGWGCWTLHERDGRLELTVVNSPFAAATRMSGTPACYPIAGMLQAVATALWAMPVHAREVRCACEAPGGAGTCSFVAAPART
ncbi:MAG: hypothetical protein JSR41_11350 [Proteobacteria bacterium]|nr:hypothetical protein [Pseudomonadota bacterium]